jgi:hypothetical protein
MRTASARYLDACSVPAVLLLWAAPISISQAQSSPFMTGATALQTNLLAWLTPIAMHLKMEQRGMQSDLAEHLRAEYRQRVARRLESTTARDPAPKPGEKHAVELRASAVAPSADVEEIRRRAREAWLQLRATEQQASGHQTTDNRQESDRHAAERDEAKHSRSPQDDLAL